MLPFPLLAFFIFKILLFDFQESVVVGHQAVAEWFKECLCHCLSTFLINSHINHRVIESDVSETVHLAVAYQEIVKRWEQPSYVLGLTAETCNSQEIAGQSKIAVASFPATEVEIEHRWLKERQVASEFSGVAYHLKTLVEISFHPQLQVLAEVEKPAGKTFPKIRNDKSSLSHNHDC